MYTLRCFWQSCFPMFSTLYNKIWILGAPSSLAQNRLYINGCGADDHGDATDVVHYDEDGDIDGVYDNDEDDVDDNDDDDDDDDVDANDTDDDAW